MSSETAVANASALCSSLSRRVREPIGGTAPYALLWVLLEQPGPWGRDAVTSSHLPEHIAGHLASLAGDLPVRVGLLRAVGAHADVGVERQSLFVASTNPESPWLAKQRLESLDELLTLDPEPALQATRPPPGLPGESVPGPERLLAVCTNSRRDRCCALRGRHLSAAFAATASIAVMPTEVWETSHLGGHRFAPTYASLPDGYLFGGPDAAFGTLDACRGRSSLPPAAQVAELAVLRAHQETTPRALAVVPDPGVQASAERSRWRVRYDDMHHGVDVVNVEGEPRPESCGREPVPMRYWQATLLS